MLFYKMSVIQCSRHCSEQIIARQGEVKAKRTKELFIFFKMKSSDDGRDEF